MKYRLRRVEVDGGTIETWLPNANGTLAEREAGKRWAELSRDAGPRAKETLGLYHSLLAMRERQLLVALEEIEALESQVAAYHAAAARVAGDALRARQDALEEVEIMLRDELGTDWADEFGSLYEAWSKIK